MTAYPCVFLQDDATGLAETAENYPGGSSSRNGNLDVGGCLRLFGEESVCSSPCKLRPLREFRRSLGFGLSLSRASVVAVPLLG